MTHEEMVELRTRNRAVLDIVTEVREVEDDVYFAYAARKHLFTIRREGESGFWTARWRDDDGTGEPVTPPNRYRSDVFSWFGSPRQARVVNLPL